MKNITKIEGIVLFSLLATIFCMTSIAQDDAYWTPKGTPGLDSGKMKTLEQLEPRTMMTNLPFRITNSGSFYLIGSLSGSDSNYGITIETNDVKVDLNGFAINGTTGALDGIYVTIPSGNISIRNGIIRGWGNGIGVNATNATDVVMTDLKAFNNGYGGLYAGPNAFLERCSVFGNGIGHGSDAIFVNSFSTIKDCKTMGNGGAGIHSFDQSRVTGCTSVMNTNADGIHLENYCTVKDCTATQNKNGITVGNFCRVAENTVGNNGWVPGGGQGINAGQNDVIERNIVCYNKFGINVSGFGTLVINNYISKSGTGGVGGTNDITGMPNNNYIGTAASFTTSNYGEFTTNNPWMNFKFGGN